MGVGGGGNETILSTSLTSHLYTGVCNDDNERMLVAKGQFVRQIGKPTLTSQSLSPSISLQKLFVVPCCKINAYPISLVADGRGKPLDHKDDV